jgi:RNA exonuclease 1
MAIAKGKIIVGHDLVNDLKLLKIKHEAFIDTVALLPHHIGLPLKNKLKDLTF